MKTNKTQPREARHRKTRKCYHAWLRFIKSRSSWPQYLPERTLSDDLSAGENSVSVGSVGKEMSPPLRKKTKRKEALVNQNRDEGGEKSKGRKREALPEQSSEIWANPREGEKLVARALLSFQQPKPIAVAKIECEISQGQLNRIRRVYHIPEFVKLVLAPSEWKVSNPPKGY